ncbi:MAG: fibronectin type III domain-containing protein [Candidatus Eisenbacteria bacterium]|nr:fibronectin type III domain-containing protein [Candidatus Eisenbacteria bacterium]
MRRRFLPIALLILGPALLLPAGCGDDSITRVAEPVRVPAAPTDLRASLGEEEATLRWEMTGEESVLRYRLYRREGDAAPSVLIDSTEARQYRDDGLVPGRIYTYEVTAFGVSGIESERSLPLTITPGSIGLTINDRAAYTASPSVLLSLTAPAGVTEVRIGEDPDLEGSFYRAYETAITWLLSEGDGAKTVYARFRTAGGVETAIAEDGIVLDTRAEILSLTEDSEGKILAPGDTLRVEMNTGEKGGTATVTIGDALIGEPLTYDTLNGVHRLVWRVPAGISAQSAVAAGSFTDRAGNSASARTSTRIALQETDVYPEPVTLEDPAESGSDWILLRWSRSAEIDFYGYRICRGALPGLQGAEDEELVAVIRDRERLSWIDSSLAVDSTTYYYRVFTEDTGGRISGSNELRASTRNAAPRAVESFTAEASSSPSTTVRLTWTAVDPSTVADFAYYEIYRSTSEAVSRESELAGVIGEIYTRNWTDEGTAQAKTYFYRIYVVDRGGLASGSEAAAVTTTDLPPSFVTLGAPSVDQANGNVILSWDRSPDTDFAAYHLYAAGFATGSAEPAFSLIDEINNIDATSYVHDPDVTDLPYSVEYYLETIDLAGAATRSNTVQAVFPPADLPVVSNVEVTIGQTFAVISFETDVPALAVVSYSKNGLSLNLQEQGAASYRTVHSIALDGLSSDSNYFFQITVEDESGGEAVSSIGSFTTLP